MNQAPAQGQGQGQPGQGMANRPPNAPNAANVAAPGGAPRQQGTPMYRPEMMRNIPLLSDEEKTKYERGLQQLWAMHDNTAPGSAENIEAKKKIAEFGRVLLSKLQQRRQQQQQLQHQRQQQQQQQQQIQQQMQQQAQQPQQTQPQQGQPQQQLQQAQVQQQVQQQQQIQQQQQQAPQQQQQQPQQFGQPGQQVQMMPQNQQPQVAQNAQPVAATTAPQQQPAPATQTAPNQMGAPNSAAAQLRSLPPHIVSHVRDIIFLAPNTIADKAGWIDQLKLQYAQKLFVMDSASRQMKQIAASLADQSLPPEERKKLEEKKQTLEKQYNDAISFANTVRKQYMQKPAQNGAAVQNPANVARPQSAQGASAMTQPGAGIGNGTPVAAPVNPMQSSAAAINTAIEAAKKQQMAAGRMAGAVNAMAAQVQSPATPAQAQVSPATQVHATQQSVPQQPQQIQQAQPTQQPQAQVKIESGTAPHPAPLNTTMAGPTGVPSAAAPAQNATRMQTPTSATPTSANANIRPLTHAAAMNLASQQRPGMPAVPTAAAGAVPGTSMGVMGAAQQQQQPGHSHAHPPQPVQQAPPPHPTNPKLPIPKVLHDKAIQMPQPVPNIGGAGSGRPTYTGGVMNQPALPKTPAFQLEGEGERVLNKKKLDELVRQVCGGTAEGQDGNMLTPEVEEVRLFCLQFFIAFISF